MATISIAIINYNRASYIERAIRSCLAQRLGDFDAEIIVVDDGSSDDSVEVVKSYPTTRLISLSQNGGVGHASDVALRASLGDFFIRVDSDDFLSQDAVHTLATVLETQPRFAFVHGDIRQVDDVSGEKRTVELDNPQDLYRFGAGVLFRKTAIEEVGGYDVTLRNCEDLDLFLRLEKRGMIGLRVPIALYRHHLHKENTSMQPDRCELWDQVFKSHGLKPLAHSGNGWVG